MHLNIISLSFIIFLVINIFIQIYLYQKNRLHILNHKDQVPKDFSDTVSLEDHRKAADYSLTKGKFGLISLFYSSIVVILWTIFGGYNELDILLMNTFQVSKMTQGTIFIFSTVIISTLLSLPFSYYQTFVIEQDFGFNKTSRKDFFIDIIKSLFVGAVLGLPFLLLVLWVFEKAGNLWWLYTWMAFTLFQFILIWAYPRLIAPLFNKFTPLEDGEMKETIEGLLKRCGFESNGLFVMDASRRSSHGNAYFTGLGKSKRIVFFDTLLKHLSAQEAEAILAHELGHFKHKHILKGMIQSIILSFLGLFILGLLSKSSLFYEAFKIQHQSPYIAISLFTSIVPIYTFIFTPLFAKISRKHEFQADEFAAKHASANDLITGLKKLFKENASTLTPHPSFSKFYYSHPPAIERVQHLKKFL